MRSVEDQRKTTLENQPSKHAVHEITVEDLKRPQEKSRKRSASAVRTLEEKVLEIWAKEETNEVEAVVGPFKLFHSSIKSLHGNNWLSDEIIDSYLHIIGKNMKGRVFVLSAVVSSALFSGNFQCVRKMRIPDTDMWLCPCNTGRHWILVIVKMSEKSVILLDPMGSERLYERKLLSNWRNFLKMRNHSLSNEDWTFRTLEHEKQIDGSSCGVLILKFAEAYLHEGSVLEVQTNVQYVKSARTQIACALIEHGGKIKTSSVHLLNITV
ncbi:sentrin-specific protease 5-like [Labeo rohita]|uniref:sentrin-specific protease 5-like n=1 Tax=Labeo rohita TaxID=84645 RepID=UPI0021E22EC5|nr:sentrin-specific protease 5-like [Labeo rohita]